MIGLRPTCSELTCHLYVLQRRVVDGVQAHVVNLPESPIHCLQPDYIDEGSLRNRPIFSDGK